MKFPWNCNSQWKLNKKILQSNLLFGGRQHGTNLDLRNLQDSKQDFPSVNEIPLILEIPRKIYDLVKSNVKRNI